MSTILAQNRNITGRVTDGKEPVIGASIQVKGTTIGTVSDENGRYNLSVPNDASTIIIKAIGLKTQELSIVGLSEINAKLEVDNVNLGEMVVTAFGIERERKTLGYSQQKVSGDELRKSGEQNMIQGLAGKAAGVYVQGSGGTPGSSSKVLLRGNVTFTGNNQPLIVVDGVPIDNNTTQSVAGDYPFNANLQGVNASNRGVDINPDDIESMNVLKGPAAAALYGVRAGAGAIIITTKKGKRGTKSFGVDFSSSLEISQVNKLPERQMKYSQGTGGGVLKADKSGSIGPGKYVPGGTSQNWGNLTKDSLGITPTDNAKDFFQTGYAYNNNISITNNTENASMRISIGRLDQTGVVPNTKFERTSARITMDSRLSKKVVMGGTVNLINSGGTRSQNGSNLSGIMLGLMRSPNSYKLNDPSAGGPNGYTNPDGTQRQYFFIYDNPYWTANENPFKDNVNRALGNIYFTVDPIEWMSLTYRLGTDMYTDQRKQIFAIGSWAPDNAPGGEIDENIIRYKEYYSDLLVTFRKDFTKDIKTSLLLGNNLNSRYDQDLYSRGRDLSAPGNYNLNNASNLYSSEANSTIRTGALFFDFNASYKNYLFLGVSGRNEWASTFGTAKNNFFYPSGNVSLVFSELVSIPKMSFGKVRFALAQAGISPIAYRTNTYFTRSTYTDGFTGGLSFPYINQNGYGYSGRIGNPNLQPEKNTGMEFGTDLRFFDNRLNVDFTYYSQKSTNLLVDRPVAPSAGYSLYYTNAGSMVNKGIELILGGTPVKMTDFSWDVSLNYSRNRNEVLELGPGIKEISLEEGFSSMGAYAIKGLPYGVLYGTRWDRTANGDFIIGANGLPRLASERGQIGNPYPRWYGGLRNTFNYKNLSFTFLFDMRVGGDIWNGTWARLNQIGVTEESAAGREKFYIIPGQKVISTAPDGTETYGPNDIKIAAYNYFRTYKGDGGNYAAENAIQDGGWVRLRDIGLSYNFKFNKKASRVIKGLQLGVTGRNLLLFTKYTGVDPETSLTGAGSNIGGWDYFNNPGTKSYTFSLKANF
ncbi:MAG: SusC/RagA family TonB-linked outer membrane protein [bacterium]|nr:SusC/RagA family TonB-linked outer membrane protein [bacterium]